MPTARKRWPNTAAWARDAAAEELVQAVRMLRPLVEGERFDRTEVLRRQAVALSSAQAALRQLEAVGAQTRGEEA